MKFPHVPPFLLVGVPVNPFATSEFWNLMPDNILPVAGRESPASAGTIHTHTTLNLNTGARCHA
ncbi:MAG: hypothetical protein MUF86_12170 [Akkermansiaceae bacterium]|jgi:hypothetical protein|nr:hypothetical protein [Akkermansiaceae bacterium]